MIHLMEHAAREALRSHLDEGEESVGVDVQITHSSATPPKSRVAAEARITKIDKNVVSFDVVARDPWGEIGRGTHRRAVIKTSKFAERLAQQKPSPQPASKAATTPPETSTIDLQQSDSVLHLTLNRPQKRNAINALMTSEMEQIVDWLEYHAPLVRVVIVRGAAGSFCAGDDVGDLPETPQAAGQLSLRRGALYQRVTSLPQIFIAAIDGLAYGGGLVLAAACDFRIATHAAKLGLPEVLLGWPPNYGLGIVQSLIGRGASLQLALTGESIDARRAESIGLVNKVVSPLQLESACTKLAEQVAALPPDAVRAAKQSLSAGVAWSDQRATDAFVECLTTETARQSIAKFRR
jgi:enoyl-CoA hydratase/carnithine racemase/predicted thioesterase